MTTLLTANYALPGRLVFQLKIIFINEIILFSIIIDMGFATHTLVWIQGPSV